MSWLRKQFHVSAAKQGSQKGVALILAMFTIVLVSYLATELAYETNVEYLVNSAAISRVKAYYAARSGLQLSLLRIKIYSLVTSKLGAQAKTMIKPEMLDMIWKMPFSWPLVLPKELGTVEKEAIEETTKASLMDSSYMATIADEGTKIDINSLWAPSKGVRENIRQQILQIFENKKRQDEKWDRAHPDFHPEEVVDNLTDWVSPSSQGTHGDKGSRFSVLGENYPPNRGFRTVDEIRLVPGVTEDIFNLIKDQITVAGMKGINPNNASKEILMSIDMSITPQVVDEIIKRRNTPAEGGAFADPQDFWNFVAEKGARVDPVKQKTIPIITDSVYNFRIISVGSYKKSSVEIEAVVFDLNKSAAQAYGQTQSEINPSTQAQGGTPPGGRPPNQPNNNNSPSKGPPRIVYWIEK